MPKWYTYDHDILLLELVMRNGLNIDKILNDLQGNKISEYKLRLGSDTRNTRQDPYYEFKRWCKTDVNILHRLRYITNVMVKNLEESDLGGDTSLMSIRLLVFQM